MIQKNRLGYGKGFYDKYLNKYIRRYKKILTIGVAFSFQKHHNLPVNKYDAKLDYILTEKRNFLMKILILGDVMGPSGREAVKKNLSKVIEQNNISFAIINGENAADDGKGITKEIAEEFFSQGIDVITSGNHIWDKEETSKFIEKEERLLRPANLAEGSPGKGFGIFLSKDKKYKIAVINLMGNVFMRKRMTFFLLHKKFIKK